MTIRVLIVDDHPVFRDGLTAALAASDRIEVAATAEDGAEAIEMARSGRFDVIVMDLSLPSMSGIDATARISELPDAPAVLVVTMVDDDDTIAAALQAGARGYVLKGASGEQIATAVHTVADGGAIFGPGIATHILRRTTQAPSPAADGGLTDRERDVLALLAEGASNAQIARALGLSVKTVQNYVSRILDKLQVADRTQAALLGRRRRLPTPARALLTSTPPSPSPARRPGGKGNDHGTAPPRLTTQIASSGAARTACRSAETCRQADPCAFSWRSSMTQRYLADTLDHKRHARVTHSTLFSSARN